MKTQTRHYDAVSNFIIIPTAGRRFEGERENDCRYRPSQGLVERRQNISVQCGRSSPSKNEVVKRAERNIM